MKRKKAFCFFLMILRLLISISIADNTADGRTMLEEILSTYSADETVPSNQLQVLHSNVNFRESPGGNVLGRLQGGLGEYHFVVECENPDGVTDEQVRAVSGMNGVRFLGCFHAVEKSKETEANP